MISGISDEKLIHWDPLLIFAVGPLSGESNTFTFESKYLNRKFF